MLLYMAIILGVVAAVIEMRTAFGVTFIRELIMKSSVIGIVFSVGLSMLIGMIFGAAGLVVMMGALIAAFITQPVYFVYSKVKNSGGEFARALGELKSLFSPFWSLIKFALYLMFLPFIAVYKILSWNANRKGAVVS